MTKQKKNELTEPSGLAEENGKNGMHEVYENTGLPEPHASHFSHFSPKKALCQIIREALAQGQGVSLPGLGSFSVMLHAARMGRNPRTGESMIIPARRRVHFKMGKGLRALLNS